MEPVRVIPHTPTEVYEVTVTDSKYCTGRDTVQLFVVTEIPVSVSITASPNPACTGTMVTFTATGINGGSMPYYQWKVNGTNAGTNSPTFTFVWTYGICILCGLTSSFTCALVNPAISNVICSIDSIDIGPNRNICPGDSVLLDAGVGMNSYLWNTGATTQTIWAKNTGKYKVTVTQGACIFSDSLMVSFNPVPNVNLGLDISICLGQTHTFDAGFCTGCIYSWDDLTTNQMNIGTNQTYTTGQAGIYRVTVTGTNGCSGRDTVQLSVNPQLTVSISITASGNPVCAGTIVTFTANPVNGGTAPVYKWYKGLTPVGSNSNTYSYIPANGDVI